jgi:hypothetical protein
MIDRKTAGPSGGRRHMGEANPMLPSAVMMTLAIFADREAFSCAPLRPNSPLDLP